MAAGQRIGHHRVLHRNIRIDVSDGQHFVFRPGCRHVIDNHVRSGGASAVGRSAGKRDRIRAAAGSFAKGHVTQNDVAIGLASAMRDLTGIPVDDDRARSRLARDVIICNILDVEAAACKSDRASHVKHNDLVGGVFDEGAAQRSRSAVIEIRHMVDGRIREPAGRRGTASERAAEAFGSVEERQLGHRGRR